MTRFATALTRPGDPVLFCPSPVHCAFPAGAVFEDAADAR